MNFRRKTTLQCEWENLSLGTYPHISIELVNVPQQARDRIQTIFENTLLGLGAMPFLDHLGMHEFEQTICPHSGPYKLHFLNASFGKLPEGMSYQSIQRMAGCIVDNLRLHMGT